MKNPLIHLGLLHTQCKIKRKSSQTKEERQGVCTSQSIPNAEGRWRRKSFLKAYYNLVEHKCMQILAIWCVYILLLLSVAVHLWSLFWLPVHFAKFTHIGNNINGLCTFLNFFPKTKRTTKQKQKHKISPHLVSHKKSKTNRRTHTNKTPSIWIFYSIKKTKPKNMGVISSCQKTPIVIPMMTSLTPQQIAIIQSTWAIPAQNPLDAGEAILMAYFEKYPKNIEKFQAFKNTPLLSLKVRICHSFILTFHFE